jgi:hypothetical protein
MRSKTPAQLFPSGFIPIRFLKLHPLSNIRVSLLEGRVCTAWEPSKPEEKNVSRPPPPLNVVCLTTSLGFLSLSSVVRGAWFSFRPVC